MQDLDQEQKQPVAEDENQDDSGARKEALFVQMDAEISGLKDKIRNAQGHID